MLYIRNLDYLPDGRSVVDTVGLKRFRVLQRGMKDGYFTADIEYLEDTQVLRQHMRINASTFHNYKSGFMKLLCAYVFSRCGALESQILGVFGQSSNVWFEC